MVCGKCEIIDVLMCSFCNELMCCGTRMCKGGHTLCEGCAAVLKRCPECGRTYTKFRNLLFEQMMEMFMAGPTRFMQEFSGECKRCSNWMVVLTGKRRKSVCCKEE